MGFLPANPQDRSELSRKSAKRCAFPQPWKRHATPCEGLHQKSCSTDLWLSSEAGGNVRLQAFEVPMDGKQAMLHHLLGKENRPLPRVLAHPSAGPERIAKTLNREGIKPR